MVWQVNNICKKGYFHLKNIASVRKSLNKHDTEKVVHAFISSVLDYGNSLLYGTAQKHLNKLQILQNSSARLIDKLDKHDHISDTLKRLHWLPVKARIDFKILLLTWKALNGFAPPYIKDMLSIKNAPRSLRNSHHLTLTVPRFNRITLGGHSFSVVAPSLWNNLPSEVKEARTEQTFRKHLKTFLFKQYYGL